MSKYLSTILGTNEAVLAHTIAKLEQATLHKSTDVHLVAAVHSGVRHKMQLLGLDAADTSAQELYHALRAKAIHDNNVLMTKMGIKPQAVSVESLHALANFFNKSQFAKEVWALKRTALKKILQTHVPHKTMKVLHYRSEASMFKRESPASIYATALLLEGQSFKDKMALQMKKCKPQDFEIHKTEIVSFTPQKWELIHKSLKKNIVPVYALPEVNCVVVVSIHTTKTSTLVLLATALVLTELYRVAAHASYLKISSLGSELGSALHNTATDNKIKATTVQGIDVTWHHVHRLLASGNTLSEAVGPHLTDEDLQWTSVEASLALVHADLGFWVDTHHLALIDPIHVVSLHIVDVALNELYDTPLKEASKSFVQSCLYDELLLRYLRLPPFIGTVERYLQKVTDSSAEVLYD